MRDIIHTFMLLLFATAVLSCDAGILKEASTTPTEDGYSITVTGTASDIESKLPIEEIRITLKAMEQAADGKTRESEMSAYTDNSGKFAIVMSGFRSPTSFTIYAEDPQNIYQKATHEIPLVTWGYDYSYSGGTFFVNGCDFHLKRAK